MEGDSSEGQSGETEHDAINANAQSQNMDAYTYNEIRRRLLVDLEYFIERPEMLTVEAVPHVQMNQDQDSNDIISIPSDEDNEQQNDRNDEPTPTQNQQETQSSAANYLDTNDDGSTCSICLEQWTTAGEHRICSLKCGHLFGRQCIQRWFNFPQNKICPICKQRAVSSHIRNIYVRKITAIDSSEVDSIKRQLEQMNESKRKIEIDLTRALTRETLLKEEIKELRLTINNLNNPNYFTRPSTSSSNEVVVVYRDRSLELSKNGGCRVIDFYKRDNLVAASLKSPNPILAGYGVRLMNVNTYRPLAYISLHRKTIRDLKFHWDNSLVMTVSLDKTVKISDLTSNAVIASYSADSALWSCCWDSNQSNHLYIGSNNGNIIKCDIRQMDVPLQVLETGGDTSPVVSVASIPAESTDCIPNGGIISCMLNSLWLYERENDDYVRQLIQVEGPFFSMSFNNNKRCLLISTRSNARYPHSRHLYSRFERSNSVEDNSLQCVPVYSFKGSATQMLLSRSRFISNNYGDFIAAYQESDKCIYLWDTNTGLKSSYVSAFEPIFDLCDASSGDNSIFMGVTERKLDFFRLAERR